MNTKAIQTIEPEQSPAMAMIAVIERAAMSKDIDIEKMERLLAMQERIMDRNAKASFAAALAEMTPKLPSIAERGSIKNNSGNVQSRYALWEDIVSVIGPILSEHGFALTFRTSSTDKSITVTGVLSHREGHSERTELTMPFDTSGSKNAVQSIGSSTSYGKRYTAGALLNLRTGDIDDGGVAGGSQSISESQAADLEALAEEVGADKRRFLQYLAVDSFEKIPLASYDRALTSLKAKRAKV